MVGAVGKREDADSLRARQASAALNGFVQTAFDVILARDRIPCDGRRGKDVSRKFIELRHDDCRPRFGAPAEGGPAGDPLPNALASRGGSRRRGLAGFFHFHVLSERHEGIPTLLQFRNQA